MTIYTAFAFVLLATSSPALADPGPPPRPEARKIRLSVRDASITRSFDVAVSRGAPCATAVSKAADHELHLQACASRDANLTIDWSVRSSAGEYHSTSTISLEHGGRAELGSTSEPRLIVMIE